jgi:hypothetical protein
MEDQYYRWAMGVLNALGEFQKANLVQFSRVYDDDKIHIEARLGKELVECPPASLWIGLKMPTQDENPIVFGLPQVVGEEKYTIVYLWVDDTPPFIRPGRWQKYLRSIVRQLDAQAIETHKLRNKPVNDSELFPDIPD